VRNYKEIFNIIGSLVSFWGASAFLAVLAACFTGGFLLLPSVAQAEFADYHYVEDVGDYSTSTSETSGSWSSAGHIDGVAGYQVAIGLDAMGDELLADWSATLPGSAFSATISGLALDDGQEYFFCVKALSAGDPMEELINCSDGFTVDVSVPSLDMFFRTNSSTGQVYVPGSWTNRPVYFRLETDEIAANIFYNWQLEGVESSETQFSEEPDFWSSIIVDGEYLFQAYVRDEAGNRRDGSAVILLDTIAPKITAFTPGGDDGVFMEGESVIINFELDEEVIVSGSGPIEATFAGVNGDFSVELALISTTSAMLSFEYLIGSADLEMTQRLDFVSLDLRALTVTDRAGNALFLATIPSGDDDGSLLQNSQISINTTPVIITLEQPLDGSVLTGMVELCASASDDTDVINIEFYVESASSSEFGAESFVGDWEYTTGPKPEPKCYSWDSTSVADGEKIIKAVYPQGSSLRVDSAVVVATVDNTAPEGQVVFSAQLLKPGATSTIDITFNEDVASTTSLSLAVTPAISASTTMTRLSPWHFQYAFLAPDVDGQFSLAVLGVADEYGNAADEIAIGSILVDNVAPSFDLFLSDADGTVRAGQSLVLTLEFSEAIDQLLRWL
jgi:hypothetical protein